MFKPVLTDLTDDELRKLQAEHPLIISDAPDPRNVYARLIWDEGKRRGLW